jgi:hypothetical protein
MSIGRDGKERPSAMLQALEVDAVELLRDRARTGKGMQHRLNARAYLLAQGWTVDEVNAAAEAGGKQ